jgi:hypothetical protein
MQRLPNYSLSASEQTSATLPKLPRKFQANKFVQNGAVSDYCVLYLTYIYISACFCVCTSFHYITILKKQLQ